MEVRGVLQSERANKAIQNGNKDEKITAMTTHEESQQTVYDDWGLDYATNPNGLLVYVTQQANDLTRVKLRKHQRLTANHIALI